MTIVEQTTAASLELLARVRLGRLACAFDVVRPTDGANHPSEDCDSKRIVVGGNQSVGRALIG